MAAYAALVSVMNLIDQLRLHPYPPISLHQKQVQSLTGKVTFLQEFLEGYSHVGSRNEADALESRIADAAYAAEDLIESHISDQILGGSSSHGENISSIEFYDGLQKVIEDIDSVKMEVMEIKEKMGGVQHQLHRNPSISAGSSRSPSMGQNRTMVGFDDVLREMKDKLTGGQFDLQIIPITGMGGIGKTTLAKNIYENQVIMERFDIRAWVTISHEYKMREILCALLREVKEYSSEVNEFELGDKLRRHYLWNRRYLIVLDDIWDIEVWNEMNFFFPNNKNGSRIILTTRLSNLAFEITKCHGLEMKLLDDNASWKLFCENVFGKEDCSPELEEIGKKIAKNCRGLPLSIVVIGGLLAKSEKTREYWGHILEDLNSIVNLENDGHCLEILSMSYNNLPVHLRPCFLYLGIFEEDRLIYAQELITLWVAEGFLKPIVGKSLEQVGEQYLKELIDRNLILLLKYNQFGKISLVVHDLIRDLCLKQAQKQKFFCVVRDRGLSIPQGISTERRIFVYYKSKKDDDESKNNNDEIPPQVPHDQALHALQSESPVRVLMWKCKDQMLLPFNFRLLRIARVTTDFLEAVFRAVNLRHLHVRQFFFSLLSGIPSSVSLLWNLQTIIIDDPYDVIIAPSEIWEMSLLRNVKVESLYLPDPPSGHSDKRDDIVLKNLRSLSLVHNFRLGEEVIKRIPNIEKLEVYYHGLYEEESPDYCLDNLHRLQKLEIFRCNFHSHGDWQRPVPNFNFPHSLKMLTLGGTRLHWKDMTTKIGSLPLLQDLVLYEDSFIGGEWETIEGQFCSLKILKMCYCDLKYWTIEDSSHFPCLVCLFLQGLNLKEIPSSIGDIPTLQSIALYDCCVSANDSAKKIQEEQVYLGNEELKVTVGDR